MKEPTEQEMQEYFDKLLNKFKQDPQYELKQEFDKLFKREGFNFK